ncbi:hypothetical protein FJ656_23820 [Schumannella luteola]|uniref:Signal peptidase I n=1 Tax=Schumannella luteola TaxID=472059 RepID=A0A852YEW3_9MICO|nr:hypothetical protein [Schumannella luteola]TPX02138.1 hypothetical protein FJ656_23820 [Schumannella luteola]
MTIWPDLNGGVDSLLQSWAAVAGSGFWFVLTAFAFWPVFAKADYPPWLGFVPIVNIYVLVKIAGYSGVAVLLFLVPFVNILFTIFCAVRIGDAFGRSGWFSFFLLFLLAPIGFFIVGWSRDEFRPLDDAGFRTEPAVEAN